MRPKTDAFYIRPQKAFERIKRAHNIRQTVYIFGASGYGKTALATNYLGRRIYEYYTAEEIGQVELPEGRTVRRERIVVIDDLHRLTTDEQREQAYPVIEALSEHPDIWLILISRSDIPAWLYSVHVFSIFVKVDEELLTLSEKETEQFMAQWQVTPLTDTMARIHQKGIGYPLVLRMTAIRLQQMDPSLQGAERHETESRILQEAEVDLWKFLESHVYSQWDEDLREFVMVLSALEYFDFEIARYITKNGNVGELIRKASEAGNFLITENKDGVETFHIRTGSRESLHKLLIETYSEEQLEELHHICGNAFEMRGDLPRALEMYEKAHDEKAIINILIENAQIHPGAGYYWQLRHYYLLLSEECVEESPILMSALSMLHSIMLNDDESERWYRKLKEYAEKETGSAKKLAQERLLYLDLSLAHRGTDDILSILKNAGSMLRSGRSILPELSLTNNQPSILDGGKDFSEWVKNDMEIAASVGKVTEMLLGQFGKGLVNLALAESCFEKGGDDQRVYRLAVKGQMQAQAGGKQELTFVGICCLANLEMLSGGADSAIEMINVFQKSVDRIKTPLLYQGIETLKTRIYLHIGMMPEIQAWMDTTPNEAEEFCSLERYRYVTKAKVYLAQGERKKAKFLLDLLSIYAEQRKRTHLLIEVKLLLAVLHFRERDGAWTNYFQEAVTLAEEYHYVRVLTREGAAIYPLLQQNRVVFTNDSFKTAVFNKCRAQAKYYPNYLAETVPEVPMLSKKAIQILKFQAEGLSVEEIAQAMGLSQAGVKYYNRETYKKLGVKGKAAAITAARNRKLI